MTIAIGNTYSVKDDLKKVGFEWIAKDKEWIAKDFDKESWENKYCSPTWNGRKAAAMCRKITLEEVK